MYLILDATNTIKEICEHPSYVKKQDNGCIVLADRETADTIYSNDTDSYYSIGDHYTVVEVEEVPADVTAGAYQYYLGEFHYNPSNENTDNAISTLMLMISDLSAQVSALKEG